MDIKDAKGKTLKLTQNQLTCLKKTEEILNEHPCILNYGETGGGKMILAGAYAKMFNYKVMVFCTKSLIPVWKSFLNQNDIEIVNWEVDGELIEGVLNYEKVRGQYNHPLTTGLLSKEENTRQSLADLTAALEAKNKPKVSSRRTKAVPKGNVTNEETIELDEDNNKKSRKNIAFQATDLLYDLLRNNEILLVFDECHKIKNKCQQHKAIKAIATACLKVGGVNRMMFTSATPITEKEHLINFLQLIGFIRNPTLAIHHKHNGELELKGAQELIDICKKYDPETTQYLCDTYPMDSKNVEDFCFKLFLEVLHSKLLVAMPPIDIPYDKYVRNLYINISDDLYKEYENIIQGIKEAAHYNAKTGFYSRKEANWGAINTGLIKAHAFKTILAEAKVRQILNDNPNKKVVVVGKYIESCLLPLNERLKDLNPILIYGKTNNRQELFDKFNEEPNSRLLIGQIEVIGLGNSLDDQVGDAPRHMLIFPTYEIDSIHQAHGRIYRQGTKSDAYVDLLYVNGDHLESSLLNSLARKTDVIKEFLKVQTEHGILYPGEYPSIIDDELVVNVKVN